MPNEQLDGQRARLIKELAAAHAEALWNATREGRIARIWRELLQVQAQVDALVARGPERIEVQLELPS